jgi:hypothetical protein
MPYAQVLTTLSKANLTGGTFADALTANTNDSAAVANFNSGGARVLEAWAIDSASVAELAWVYTRPQATHDQSRGFRVMIPGSTFGAVGARGALMVLPGADVINLFKSDTATVNVSGTAADNVVLTYVIEYDDLPGASAVFASPQQVRALQLSKVGIRVDAVASGTAGQYGTSRAFNADDDRLHANTWYAILGWSVQIAVTTVALIGPDWGGQRIGGPAGILQEASNTWFLDQSVKWGKPLIPCFNSNNKANVLVSVADGTASTSPKIDFNLVELTGMPSPGV